MLPPPSADSTVLITGASSGIGEQIATELARRHYGVTLLARRTERLEALASRLSEAHGVVARVLSADLRNLADRDLIAESVETGPRLVGLVNNAGFGSVGWFSELPLDRQRDQIAVNVDALVWLTHRFLPLFVSQGVG